MCASQNRPIVKPARKYFDPAQNAWPLFAVEQFGLAIDYALGQWRTLAVYLKDGQVEIDNNLVENAIHPTAIGKKRTATYRRRSSGLAQRHHLHRHQKLPPT